RAHLRAREPPRRSGHRRRLRGRRRGRQGHQHRRAGPDPAEPQAGLRRRSGRSVEPSRMSDAPPVLLRRLDPRAVLPQRMTALAAGLDLSACMPDGAPIEFEAGARALIPTGWAIAIAPGYEAQVRPRSGLALRHGLTVLNAPG